VAPAHPFRLNIGDPAPMQQSQISCGAACLVVSRMLLDATYAGHVLSASERGPGPVTNHRFAAMERVVMNRTNSAGGYFDRTLVPWPKRFGTSPWGAKAELENGAATPGTPYRMHLVRHLGPEALGTAYDSAVASVQPGRPALLYVGSDELPRHVTLVFAIDAWAAPVVYEPASGQVRAFDRDAFTSSALGLGGWDRPWVLVEPHATVAIADRVGALARRARGLLGRPAGETA
jgi:hypothetical protein